MATSCTMYLNAIDVPYATAEEADASDEQRAVATFLLNSNIVGVDQTNSSAIANALLANYTMTATA